MRDREKYRSKRDKTRNVSRQQKSNDDRSSFQQKHKGPAPSYVNAPIPKNIGEHYRHNSIAKPAVSLGRVVQEVRNPPTYAKCGRKYSTVCGEGSADFFKCNQTTYFMRESLKNRQGTVNGGNRVESSSVSTLDRVVPRVDTSSKGGGTNLLYALNNRKEHIKQQNVVTSMFKFFDSTIEILLFSKFQQ